MPSLHATPTPLTLSHVDVKAGGDRLYGRDIRLIVGDDLDLLDVAATLRADFKGQGRVFDSIHLIWNGSKRGGMPWLTTRRLRVLLGRTFGEGRSLALAAATQFLHLTAQLLHGCL